MRLDVHVRDSESTQLVDERVRDHHRRDNERQFSLITKDTFTPKGMPVGFWIDIGPRGQGLKVYSAGVVLLWVYNFDVNSLVQLRLATDEVIQIELREQ